MKYKTIIIAMAVSGFIAGQNYKIMAMDDPQLYFGFVVGTFLASYGFLWIISYPFKKWNKKKSSNFNI